MSEAACTVLCVDDEPNILLALQRSLRGSGMRVLTAGGGPQALALLETEPVDVLLCDMRMPGMDGAQVFAYARARWPDTMRLLLTGHADQQDTVRVINDGHVFGYLAKPWDAGALTTAIGRAAEVGRLTREKARLEALTRAQNDELCVLNASLESLVAERTSELEQAHAKVKRNYMTSIKVFSNLIELRSGQLIGHGRRVAELARQIALALRVPDEAVQRVFVGGLLHDIGLIGMPDAVLERPLPTLDADHQALHRRHAALGEQALLGFEDMQPVAALIRAHHERFDGRGFPDALAGEAIELGARILAAADTWDELRSGALGVAGLSNDDVRVLMQRGRGTQFDPAVLDALLQVTQGPAEAAREAGPVPVVWHRLEPGMEVGADIRSREGLLLLAVDHVLTEEMISRIGAFARREAPRLRLFIKPASIGRRAAAASDAPVAAGPAP